MSSSKAKQLRDFQALTAEGGVEEENRAKENIAEQNERIEATG